MLKDKKIIIGITAGIAAYKIPYLIRLLIKEGAEVKVIMTPAARDFVTPLTIAVLSKNPCLTEPFERIDGSWNSHVELGNWADLFLIAPATATSLGKMANGIADNLLLATYLAAKCPVYFAPSMDIDMYQHPSTQKNIETLQSFGNKFIAPNSGELASGLCGPGRISEPEDILEILKSHFQVKQSFSKKKVLISAGPTVESIDPVRYISNHSSGLMGYKLAEEFADRGASVTLVSGPTNLKTNYPSINLIDVVSAEEMYHSCIDNFQSSDICIMSAAVSDFKAETIEVSKIKKEKNLSTINLVPTKDILSELGKRKSKNQVLIGFALETDNEFSNAKKKLKNKNLDLIVLNSLKDKGAGFKQKTNKISIIDNEGEIMNFGLKSKEDVAKDIADKIYDFMQTSIFE
ncbi:MAG: bifunctional phosphopantothenoylcysteine decarboxylase/phosphopantothenate--cysteine ligase CoaBC [Bacteroidales bacterium]|nr:bifunctional phosphopantothenoylcysteine decarboxylase/phosphopantothenate--cysteine ligase CoaBC [Bacteroidales bacterium]